VAPSTPEEPREPESGEVASAEPVPRRRTRRRVSTEPAPGSDPTPQKEPPRHSENENDERLKRDTPPHWGYRF
jgi:hypothetical protein